MNRDPYTPVAAVIEDVTPETPNITTFTLRPGEPIGFRTGQFVEVTVPGAGEAPFTPSSSPRVQDRMDISVMKVGHVTSRLHELEPGATIGVRGPYGTGYPLEEFEGKEVLIVGGGVGLAPLRSLILALKSDIGKYRRVILCYGARSPVDLLYQDLLKEWTGEGQLEVRVTVDEGDGQWEGKVGVVTLLLDDVSVDVEHSVCVVCGPPIMMRFTTLKLLADLKYQPGDIYLSMEKNMSCGIGKCEHCAIGPYYVCKDGPVFPYEKLKDLPGIWD